MKQIENATAVRRRYERPGGAGRKITQQQPAYHRQISHFEAAGRYQRVYRWAPLLPLGDGGEIQLWLVRRLPTGAGYSCKRGGGTF
jgi:cell division FtsZ-interacting protein ZapD